jgi:hypothetical protein
MADKNSKDENSKDGKSKDENLKDDTAATSDPAGPKEVKHIVIIFVCLVTLGVLVKLPLLWYDTVAQQWSGPADVAGCFVEAYHKLIPDAL